MPTPVKRAYDGSRRAEQAEQLRRHIVDTAKPLFLANGYEQTSMRQLADAAGVSLQTLYNAFDSKFGLFSRLMEVTVAGDHEPLALSERDYSRELQTIKDPRAFIEAYVQSGLAILERLEAIYPVLRAATASDPQIAEAHAQFTMHARHVDMRNGAEQLAQLKGVRKSLGVDYIADTIWTILAPDVFDLLVTYRGWTSEQFAAWATDTLCATLLEPK